MASGKQLKRNSSSLRDVMDRRDGRQILMQQNHKQKLTNLQSLQTWIGDRPIQSIKKLYEQQQEKEDITEEEAITYCFFLCYVSSAAVSAVVIQ